MTALRAVVFDFDGLILDTEIPSFRSWQETYEAHGATLDEAEWHAAIGTLRGLNPYELLLERATLPVPPVEELLEMRNQRKMELVLAEAVLPGVLEWLAEAVARDLRLGVASTSPPEWVEPHLERLGLRSHFQVVSCWQQHLQPKPAPDVYCAALDALGVGAAEAIAVEDSPNGVTAAKAAGLFCVAVPNGLTSTLDFSAADMVVSSLADLPLRDLIDQLTSD
jgi:HAD superfamily hydrolase (TIGR01509 family)